MSIVENLIDQSESRTKYLKKVPVFDLKLESVDRMSHLDRFGEVLEAEVVEAFSALLRHCAWAVVTLDSDWSNGLSKDDDLGEVVVDNDYDWSDKKSIVLLEKSFLVDLSILLFEPVREVETGSNQMFHNRQNQFDLMKILVFGILKKKSKLLKIAWKSCVGGNDQ